MEKKHKMVPTVDEIDTGIKAAVNQFIATKYPTTNWQKRESNGSNNIMK